MLYQIEVTTYCNLQCFYCPIETIENKHIEYEKFCNIVDSFDSNSIVRLQGTNADIAKVIIDESGLEVKSATLLKEAADAVKAVLA